MATKQETILQDTLEFWQSRTDRELSLEDAREIRENLLGFFRKLVEIKMKTGSYTGRGSGSNG